MDTKEPTYLFSRWEPMGGKPELNVLNGNGQPMMAVFVEAATGENQNGHRAKPEGSIRICESTVEEGARLGPDSKIGARIAFCQLRLAQSKYPNGLTKSGCESQTGEQLTAEVN